MASLRSLSLLALALLPVRIIGAQPAIVFEGARLITGDGGIPIENGVLVVRNGRLTAVGAAASIRIPANAQRVDLRGKTVIPALINVHTHLGYEGYTSWGAANHTPENLANHLEREAFYGTAAVVSVGSSPVDMSLQFQRRQRAGKTAPAARYLFAPGYAPPNGGPDEVLREATRELHAVNEVSTAAEARASIQRMAAKGIRAVKIWVDDRRGTYPKMTPDVYNAIISEAHRHRMIVHAHATTLADQKAVLRAGADVLVHVVQAEKVDDELVAIVAQTKPYWATVIGLGDPVAVCAPDPFFEQSLPPAVVQKIRANKERRPLTAHCAGPAPNAAAREDILAYNLSRMVAAGARMVMGTDTGVHPGHTFGSGEHVEVARWVQLGLSPADAIVAATQRPAQLLGLNDLGTLAVGKRASFVVLDGNPLDDILNTRRIHAVYLDGVPVDRAASATRFQK